MTAGHRSWLSWFCTRRTFLLSALLSLTAGGFAANRYSLANSEPQPCVEPPWLWKTIAERQSAARIGQACLDAHSEYRQCHTLITDIERTLKRQDPSVSLTADAAQTASALQRLVRKEYARGEVVSVADWVLSKTEARLYALVYLVTTIEPFRTANPE
ncbi:MAG: hypothetical protein U9P00_13280 [Pseudomonadota bacterium]|nr:hypothetical protein [Pseudomonadota bacterium]